MRNLRWLALAVLLALPCATAQAHGWRNEGHEVRLINKRLVGKIIDHTANSGEDQRMWARSLWQRRDLYVYLPPGYNKKRRYPVMIWLHGFHQDERAFMRHIAPVLDEAIRIGKLPPLIVAAPDGSMKGESDPLHSGSFFVNSPQGAFADFVLHDVWDFVCRHYSIRRERQAHIVAGSSMGGFAAYNYAIKHREAFGNVIGIMPPLNLRWVTHHGHCHVDFHPRSWAWLTDIPPKHFSLKNGLTCNTNHAVHSFASLYTPYKPAITAIALENPIEMIDRCKVAPGQLEMYVGYTLHDKYNIDAQVQSFLYFTRWRGLRVAVGIDEHGKHSVFTTQRLLEGAIQWLSPRIAPYSPTCPENCAPIQAVGCFENAWQLPYPPQSPRAVPSDACADGGCRYPSRLPAPAKK